MQNIYIFFLKKKRLQNDTMIWVNDIIFNSTDSSVLDITMPEEFFIINKNKIFFKSQRHEIMF